MKRRLVLPLVALALAGAGCGSSGSTSTDPAGIAPPDSPVFIEAAVRPGGSLKSNVDSLAQNVAGIGNVGAKIVTELEKAASADGESFDYAKEVEPWLGEKAGLFLVGYDGDNFSGYGVVLPTSDTSATQEFIDKQAKSSSGEPAKDGSFEGVDYKVESDDGTTLGVIEDFLVIAQDEGTFKEAVEASKGESLADVERFSKAVSGAPSDSLADVYADIGGLIKQSGGSVDSQALTFLDAAGIDPREATATASVVPGSDQIEVDFSTDLTGDNPPSGDASDLLGSLPAESFAAFVSPDFGKGLGEAIDNIDAAGIPGQVPPHKLKSTLQEAGIDLDQIAGSIGDVGVFAEGSGKSSLGGAVVLTTKEASEATNTVSNIGLLLRAAHTPGVTAISGKASGFSIRSSELGKKPIVVAAEGERIAIGYGLPAALQGLAESGQALSGAPDYKEAVSALGGTPITGFVDGPATLRLVESFVPPSETGFQEAKPYLAKASFVAVGGGVENGLSTAKLIVGFSK
jgi:uncharacterized protein DUF3352